MDRSVGRTGEQRLTIKQAYEAMYLFLEDYQKRGHSDDIFMLLHALRLTGLDETTDPGSWSDWLKSVEAAKRGGEA